MSHSISQKFNARTLLGFAFPTIVMMVFMSLYTMVDGFFVSRYVGADALSAINIVYPLIGLAVGIGIMLGTGGSAVIARQLGIGEGEEARKNFTRILLFGLIVGILFTVICTVFLEPLLKLMGASDRLMGYCREYMLVLLPFMAPQLLQTTLGVLFVTAGFCTQCQKATAVHGSHAGRQPVQYCTGLCLYRGFRLGDCGRGMGDCGWIFHSSCFRTFLFLETKNGALFCKGGLAGGRTGGKLSERLFGNGEQPGGKCDYLADESAHDAFRRRGRRGGGYGGFVYPVFLHGGIPGIFQRCGAGYQL